MGYAFGEDVASNLGDFGGGVWKSNPNFSILTLGESGRCRFRPVPIGVKLEPVTADFRNIPYRVASSSC
jgi:hypothetical protein